MPRQVGGIRTKEHIWLVALYELEERADELLQRLDAIGIDTSEATTVRVEVDDDLRSAKLRQQSNHPPLSPLARSAITGSLVGGALALFIGIVLYVWGLFTSQVKDGLFNHSILFVISGASIGAIIGIVLASANKRKLDNRELPPIQHLRSEGYLVAVKMPPPLAEQAEEIARGLGAKEILL
jgi:hypothetical protein